MCNEIGAGNGDCLPRSGLLSSSLARRYDLAADTARRGAEWSRSLPGYLGIFFASSQMTGCRLRRALHASTLFVLVSISAAVEVDWRQVTEKLWSKLSGGYPRFPLAFSLGRTWPLMRRFFPCPFAILSMFSSHPLGSPFPPTYLGRQTRLPLAPRAQDIVAGDVFHLGQGAVALGFSLNAITGESRPEST
jgi:hypothetical protein